jgi:transcriptional regulator with XRE-family HTH domain
MYRKTLGLSQAGLAEKADTATNYIALIEMEKRFSSTQMLEKIAATLNVDTTELLSKEPMEAEIVKKLYAIKKLHEDILLDIEKVIANKIHELEETI